MYYQTYILTTINQDLTSIPHCAWIWERDQNKDIEGRGLVISIMRIDGSSFNQILHFEFNEQLQNFSSVQ